MSSAGMSVQSRAAAAATAAKHGSGAAPKQADLVKKVAKSRQKNVGFLKNVKSKAGTEWGGGVGRGLGGPFHVPSASSAENWGPRCGAFQPHCLVFSPPPPKKRPTTPHFFSSAKGSRKGETCLVKPQRERQAGRKKQGDLQENTEGESSGYVATPHLITLPPPPQNLEGWHCGTVGVTSIEMLAQPEQSEERIPVQAALLCTPSGRCWGEIP